MLPLALKTSKYGLRFLGGQMAKELSDEGAAVLRLLLRTKKHTGYLGMKRKVPNLKKVPRTTGALARAMYFGSLETNGHAKALIAEILTGKKKKLPTGRPNTAKWVRMRYVALHKAQGKCALCGATAKDGTQMHVDHIKPVSKYAELAHDPNNLQVLCQSCNLGKMNRDETDWR